MDPPAGQGEPVQDGAVTGVADVDTQWVVLAKSLDPVASLAALADHAKWLVATVGTIGTLITGFGLVSAPLIAASGTATTFAVVALLAAGLSLLIATFALRLRRASLNVSNLAEVEEWYGEEMRRATAQQIAGGLLIVAVVSAGLATGVVLVGAADDDLAAQLVTHREVGGGLLAGGSVACSSCEPAKRVSVKLVQVDGTREDELVSATAETAPDGSLSLDLPEVEVEPGVRLDLVVDGCIEATLRT